MLEAKGGIVVMTVEVVKFEVWAHLVRTLVVIHVGLDEPTELAPRREELYYLYCGGLADRVKYVGGR
jgi:hypothetical protein